MNRLAVYLNKHLDGVAYSAPSILSHYATDRSLLRYYPRIVALPANAADVRKLVQFSNLLARKKVPLPLSVRGAGQGKNGAALSTGLVISLEKLDRVQELDVRQRLVRVQCGIRLSDLKKSLLLHGLDLPVLGNPDATIGGLLSEAAPASNNTEPGTIMDFVEQAEVVLSDGSLVQTHCLSKHQLRKKCAQKDLEGKIYRETKELLEKLDKEHALSEVESDKSGYPGLRRVKRGRHFDLTPIFVGSEGSLGVITEVILRCEPVFDVPDYFAIACENATLFSKVTALLKELKFTDQEIYDAELFNEASNIGKSSNFYRKANGDGLLVVANAKDDSRRLRQRKLRRLKKRLPASARLILADNDNSSDFAALRANLSAYLNDSTATAFHLPVVDGAFIPPERQADFLQGLNVLSKNLKLKLAVFGLGDFNLFTVRPCFAPSTTAGRQSLLRFIRQYLALIKSCDGSPCGAAGEGRFLAAFTHGDVDTHTLRLAGAVKQIFDPLGILNPGIKHEVEARTVLKHFRTDYNSGVLPIE